MHHNKRPSFKYDLELDLHGCTREDALYDLDMYVGKHPGMSIMVIHGKGDGIVKAAVRTYLGESTLVREVYHGEDLNIPGGDGVTVIYTY